MRTETKLAGHALINGLNYSGNRTTVARGVPGAAVEHTLYLHGNPIVRRIMTAGERQYMFNMCGFPSRTTLDRLNGVTELLWGERMFRTHKGKVYFGPSTLCEMEPHDTITLPANFNPKKDHHVKNKIAVQRAADTNGTPPHP